MLENIRFQHICEVCGKKEFLTADEAFYAGWDYPPHFGAFGVVSPRTCPDCDMMDTAWFALQLNKSVEKLTEKQRESVLRILGEPGNIVTEIC